MFLFICANKEVKFFWVCFEKTICKPLQQSIRSLFKILWYSFKMFIDGVRSISISIVSNTNVWYKKTTSHTQKYWIKVGQEETLVGLQNVSPSKSYQCCLLWLFVFSLLIKNIEVSKMACLIRMHEAQE